MKKILKILLCFVVAFGATFGLVACDKEEIKNETESPVVEKTTPTSIDYSKEVSKSILNNAFQDLLTSKQVGINTETVSISGNKYEEVELERKILIKDGIKYTYTKTGNVEVAEGQYDNKDCYVNIKTKKYMELTGEPQVIPQDFVWCGKFDLIPYTQYVNYVESGRYYDGAVYITIKSTTELGNGVGEIKIVDGKIISITSSGSGEDEDCYIYESTKQIFTYDDVVDVSNIPISLTGYTVYA